MMNQLIEEVILEHKVALKKFERNSIDTVKEIARIIFECLQGGATVYLCGNGGSAADCQHIAGEFVGRFRVERKPLAAVVFCTDTSVITCIGNDYSFEDIFARQAEALLKKGDILWAFSTSGNSANVLKAAQKARDKEAKIIAFTGRADSELEKISDVCLCADNANTSTSQEVHMLAYHTICSLIDFQYAGNK